MFDIGPFELAVLAVIAVVLFGPERLPEFARKAARVLRYLRGVANNAQSTLSRELGTEVDIRDLNPKTFVKKHLMDEVQPYIDDVKKDFQEADAQVRAEVAEVREDVKAMEETPPVAPVPTVVPVPGRVTPFDPEAT